jgi:alpha-tubulin suppressor-like RCC1 family protein
VYSWGSGEYLALGHGTKTSLNTPRIIQSLEGKRIRDIAVGREFSMALTSSGEVYVWGKGSAALGLGSNADEPYPRHNTALSVCFSLSLSLCVCLARVLNVLDGFWLIR